MYDILIDNCSKTVFSSLRFHRSDIFTVFEFNGDEIFLCKVPIKPIAQIIKNSKKIERLEISIDVSDPLRNEVAFEFVSELGTKKTHRFYFQDTETLNAVFPENDYSLIIADPKLFLRLLDHIRHSIEIIIEVSSTSFRIKSFHQASNKQNQHRYMTSDITSPMDTFDTFRYISSSDCEELIFCVKELRALLTLSESTEGSELAFKFTNCGSPIEFILKCGNLEIELMVATLSHSSQVRVPPESENPAEEMPGKEQDADSSEEAETKAMEMFHSLRKRKKTFLDDDDDDD